MKLTLTRALAGHAIGDTIDRNEQVAHALIAAGAATATSDDAKADDPKPKQSRRSTRRKGEPTERDDAKTADEPAGHKGGGVPPRSPSPTAG